MEALDAEVVESGSHIDDDVKLPKGVLDEPSAAEEPSQDVTEVDEGADTMTCVR